MAENVPEKELVQYMISHQQELGFIADIRSFCQFLLSIGVTCKADLHDIRKRDIPKETLPIKQRTKVVDFFMKNVTPRGGLPVKTDNLDMFLRQCELSKSSEMELHDYLVDELDVTSTDNLCELEEDDIRTDDIPLSVIEWNRFFWLIKRVRQNDKSNASNPPETEASATTTLPVKSVPVPSENLISIHYVHFNNMNESGIKKTVDRLSHTSPMEDVMLQVMERENADFQECTIELYSSEGYPLNINEFTSKKSLLQWKVKDKDLFYVFTRKKKQPGETSLKSLPPVDHEEGGDELEIVSGHLNGTVKIRVDISADSPENICRKVYNATGIPTTHMSLYYRDPKRKVYKELDLYSHLRDGDVLTMVLKSPAEESTSYTTEYGKRTYNMLIPQTDRGLSAFFAILRYFLVKQKGTVDISQFLRILLTRSNCPPLVYALKVLYEDSFCGLSGWVAILEGFFVLFKKWLSSFEAIVEDKEVFEFSDYFWAAILNYMQENMGGYLDSEDMDTIRRTLLCPISSLKIVSPISVCGCPPDVAFDEQSVLENLGKKPLEMIKEPLSRESIAPEEELARLLMYNPCKSDHEVIVWKTPPQYDQPAQINYKLPCKWIELAGCLDVLNITVPYPLLGMGSLTYIEEGRIVLYMGFTKDNDTQCTVYDPLQNGLVKKDKNALEVITKDSKDTNVTSRDLTKLVPSKCLINVSTVQQEAARPKPPSKNLKSDWKAQEAVMVILDTSGSMSSQAFGKLNRLDVAKHLFGAFRLRTQAYDLFNAVGLISFDHIVSFKLELDRCSDDFENALEGLEPAGRTALHSAMKAAADKLLAFQPDNKEMPRRILCLTDGYECASETDFEDPVYVLNYLLERKIIVDTVLVDSSNTQQKAISHATGGACFKPGDVKDALKLFEMETFLSYMSRDKSRPIPQTISESIFPRYEDLASYPFDEYLQSNLFEKELPRTMSAARIEETEVDPKQLAQKCSTRILKEISEFSRSPLPHLAVFPSETDIRLWIVLLKGPDSSPYAKGLFLLQVRFPSSYPFQPPDVRFHEKTPIHHCNINSNGRICHKILSECYCSHYTMKDILGSVYGLLMIPEPDDPLDSVIADQVQSSKLAVKENECLENETEFWKAAEAHTKQHAYPRAEYVKYQKELSGEGTPSS